MFSAQLVRLRVHARRAFFSRFSIFFRYSLLHQFCRLLGSFLAWPGRTADDTVKSLQEDDKYIDLHMKCDGTHTHIGGRCGSAAPLCVCRHHTRSYANPYICHLLVSFLLCHLRLAGRAWLRNRPGRAKKSKNT